jgi:TetR/AcrR family transcriptional regulator
MGRPRSADYDAKRDAILAKAAELFARQGYHGASLADIAVACGVSKALLYHYCASKEDLLDAIIARHLADLIGAVRAADDPAAAPDVRLGQLAQALLEAYRDADLTHKIQINELDRLPSDRQTRLKDMERELVAIFAAPIAALEPALARRPDILKPMTMSLFGMLNWHYLWFKPDKGQTRAEYAAMAADLIVEGVRKRGADAPAQTSARARPAGSRPPKRS